MQHDGEGNKGGDKVMGEHHFVGNEVLNGFPLDGEVMSPTGAMSPPELDVDFVLGNNTAGTPAAAPNYTGYSRAFDEAAYAAAYQRQRWQQWHMWTQKYAAAAAAAAAQQGSNQQQDGENTSTQQAAAAVASWYPQSYSGYNNNDETHHLYQQQQMNDTEYQKRLQAYWQQQSHMMNTSYTSPPGNNNSSSSNRSKKASSTQMSQEMIQAQVQQQQQMFGAMFPPNGGAMDDSHAQEWNRWMAMNPHDPYNFTTQMPAATPTEQLSSNSSKKSRKKPSSISGINAQQQAQQQHIYSPEQQNGDTCASTTNNDKFHGDDDDDDDDDDPEQSGKRGAGAPMKRARWGATHAIHEYFADGFPELQERFVRQRASAAQRRYEYNLGSCRFPDATAAAKGLKRLKTLFRALDAACEDVDQHLGNMRREEFSKELRKWGWRRGARLQYRKNNPKNNIDSNNGGVQTPIFLPPDNTTKSTHPISGTEIKNSGTYSQGVSTVEAASPATSTAIATASNTNVVQSGTRTATNNAPRVSSAGSGSSKEKRPAPIAHQQQQQVAGDWNDHFRTWPGMVPPVPPAAMLAAAAGEGADTVSPEGGQGSAELWWQQDYALMSRYAQERQNAAGIPANGDEKMDEAAVQAAQQQWIEAANAEAAQWGYPSAAAYQQAAAAAWYNYAAYQRQHQQQVPAWGELSPQSAGAQNDQFALGAYDHVPQTRGGVAADHDHHSLGPIDDYDFENFDDASTNNHGGNHGGVGGKKKRKAYSKSASPPPVIGLDDLAGLAASSGMVPNNSHNKKRHRAASPASEVAVAALTTSTVTNGTDDIAAVPEKQPQEAEE